MHSRAAALDLGSSSLPSLTPIRMPAQVRTVADYLTAHGHHRRDLGFGGFAPGGMPLRDAGDPGYQQPVTVRYRAIMSHLAIIERKYDKSKLAVRGDITSPRSRLLAARPWSGHVPAPGP